ncbi:MAG: hypothetical protein QME79_12580 [Bacillota bacterium]|nr:hypothetical protein [Bacillota bacterium]
MKRSVVLGLLLAALCVAPVGAAMVCTEVAAGAIDSLYVGFRLSDCLTVGGSFAGGLEYDEGDLDVSENWTAARVSWTLNDNLALWAEAGQAKQVGTKLVDMLGEQVRKTFLDKSEWGAKVGMTGEWPLNDAFRGRVSASVGNVLSYRTTEYAAGVLYNLSGLPWHLLVQYQFTSNEERTVSGAGAGVVWDF